jgi:hypothetical protein
VSGTEILITPRSIFALEFKAFFTNIAPPTLRCGGSIEDFGGILGLKNTRSPVARGFSSANSKMGYPLGYPLECAE